MILSRLYHLLAAVAVAAMPLRGGVSPISIWDDTDCRASVRLTPYPADPETNRGIACIVCPGGSYFWLDRATEGDGVARWLQSQGITAFVLEYRVGGIAGFIFHHRLVVRGNRYPDPLQDVQRSIQLVRERAADYGCDPSRIGVMGFSAGGHLTAMSGLFFDTDVLSETGVRAAVSLRPDFIAPIYPVVSLTADWSHGRSRRGLLGEGADISAEMMDSLSLERRVRPDMPPTFLMNCVDDPVVDYRNSVELASALAAAGVPHRYVQYATGGHGFGASPEKTTPEAIAWKEEFIDWLTRLFQ